MTKGQAYALFMSNSTKEALTQPVDDLVFVDEFEVRGRQGTVKIWSNAACRRLLRARLMRTHYERAP